MSVRNYAILWPETRRTATTASGGNQLLSTEQHSLDGPEHTGQLPETRISTTETDTALVLHPDGLGSVEWGVDETGMSAYFAGALSFPPTKAEIVALAGPPTSRIGSVGILADTTLGIRWTFGSDGANYYLDTLVLPKAGAPIGGGGETVYALTSAPEGGWSWFEDPRGVAHGDYTYVGYIDASGNVKIDVSLAGAHVATRTLHAALEVDDHDPPTLYVRTDGKLIAWYSKHLGNAIYQRMTTNSLDSDPTISGGLGSETSLSSTLGSSQATYPSPIYLSAPDGGAAKLYLFWREHVSGTAYLWYAASTDEGSTWGASVTTLHNQTYSKIVANGSGRIDVACSLHANAGATKIYHLYRESAAWHLSDGTSIPTTPGDLPLDGADLTTVYTASGTDVVWVTDLAIDTSGNPVILFARWPSNDTSDVRHMYALWDGAAWQVNEIVAGGGYIPDTVVGVNPLEEYYHGGAVLDHADPQVAYVCRPESGEWELFKYVTADGGDSFTETQITSGSSSKNIRPISIREAADVEIAWLYGTYHSYVDYSLGIKGLVP